MMMKMKPKFKPNSKPKGLSPVHENSVKEDNLSGDWELRPGGMLVQKRVSESDRNSFPILTIRVRVKYGSATHEIHISPHATFGELKKLLSEPTGLHHQDQKLVFKGKERDSKAYVDVSGVKDGSKIVMTEDPISKEKRYLEMRRKAKIEKDSKCISEISLEVDRLSGQVSALESKAGKVSEANVGGLIELLMNQLLKLEGISGDGDVKLQRKLQVRRVQKYVETLDTIKANKFSPNGSNGVQKNVSQILKQNSHAMEKNSISGSVVVTTKWETFDSAPLPSTSNDAHSTHPKFNWELF